MAGKTKTQHTLSTSTPRRKRGKKIESGTRLVPQTAEQVDQVAYQEGRGSNPNVQWSGARCPHCFLKPAPGKSAEHSCIKRVQREGAGRAPAHRPKEVKIYSFASGGEEKS